MSNLNTREEKLSILFATHPKTDKFYLASDDRAFFDQHNADGYAQGLKDRKVTEYSRNVVEHFTDFKKEPIEVTEIIEQTETADETEKGTGAGEDEGSGSAEGEGAGASEGEGIESGEGAGEGVVTGDGTEDPEKEKAAVIAQYVEVIGKKPSNFMKVETMKLKIAEALAAK